ncbi:unnamed protein product [Miscanthus lutarioriparius]|uniref:Uncharacterized protein n=1 Tax=Miscanthus lutarioriparius TaxID=422564 RepID=A0A811PGV7_9POAL|nr:unnamed protein product [Miscanthus lutarioriparius]
MAPDALASTSPRPAMSAPLPAPAELAPAMAATALDELSPAIAATPPDALATAARCHPRGPAMAAWELGPPRRITSWCHRARAAPSQPRAHHRRARAPRASSSREGAKAAPAAPATRAPAAPGPRAVRAHPERTPVVQERRRGTAVRQQHAQEPIDDAPDRGGLGGLPRWT